MDRENDHIVVPIFVVTKSDNDLLGVLDWSAIEYCLHSIRKHHGGDFVGTFLLVRYPFLPLTDFVAEPGPSTPSTKQK